MKRIITIAILLLTSAAFADGSDRAEAAEDFLDFYCDTYECSPSGEHGRPVPDENIPIDAYYVLYGTDQYEVEEYLRYDDE